MCKVSCDICKFGVPHDYVPNHYYCNKNLFFNDRTPRSNCEEGEIDDRAYKYKYGVSYTMSQFNATVAEIKEMRNREKVIVENFEKSTCELAECFHWILKAALEGKKHCCLIVNICPELYAKKLKEMGFEVEEKRNIVGTLCGYDISWS